VPSVIVVPNSNCALLQPAGRIDEASGKKFLLVWVLGGS